MKTLVVRDDKVFDVDGKDFGDVLEIRPISACPDRGNIAMYIVEVIINDDQIVKVGFAVEPNSELDAWLWTSLNHKTWIWIDDNGEIGWEASVKKDTFNG